MTTLKQTATPRLPDVLREVKKDVGISYNSVSIGIIQEFDETKQIATIRLAIKKILSEEPDGTKIYKEHPLLMECPVMTMFGGDSFINLPIAVGDNCIVLFCDRDMDEWVVSGGVQAPNTKRLHDISDAIAIVGIRHYQNSITQFLANGIRISFASDSRIDLTDDAINSIAELFTHTGSMKVTGDFTIDGDTYGNATSGNWNLKSNLTQESGKSIHAGNGASGTFDVVTVVDGIVVGGS